MEVYIMRKTRKFTDVRDSEKKFAPLPACSGHGVVGCNHCAKVLQFRTSK